MIEKTLFNRHRIWCGKNKYQGPATPILSLKIVINKMHYFDGSEIYLTLRLKGKEYVPTMYNAHCTYMNRAHHQA